MSNHNEERNMGSALWQSQELEAPRISLKYVRHQATKLNLGRRRDLGLMYTVIGVIVFLVGTVFLLPNARAHALVIVLQVSTLLLLAGSAYLTMQMRQRQKPLSIADGEKVVTSLEAYRVELKRRRDLYAYFGTWRSLWPMLPAFAVIFIGGIAYDPLPHKLARWCSGGLLAVIGIPLGLLHNRRKQFEIQSELDALETLDR
jgi:hypothetical protein